MAAMAGGVRAGVVGRTRLGPAVIRQKTMAGPETRQTRHSGTLFLLLDTCAGASIVCIRNHGTGAGQVYKFSWSCKGHVGSVCC